MSLTYAQWKRVVDLKLREKHGLSIADFTENRLQDLYDAEYIPAQAVKQLTE